MSMKKKEKLVIGFLRKITIFILVYHFDAYTFTALILVFLVLNCTKVY